eukprot:CAMPEP_0204616074 /NCGR_PEP_ID=MMETSP0717-20131115/3406_1 /ASSEMBLY_ACC=CAM_ASM_000666 /TAXON_ID=230516 /ORGANISM="Chaetoceros curvisetus" /LENGTH=182 /DNA_ID=CAMNT_0051629189 /DNA_START=76 /DNA_END=624 /DNA_ORIENTATION=+
MTDDKYNDAKYLLDEMEEQESKWRIQLSEKTSQIDTLQRDKAYMQRKFHDLEIKYEKDMLTYRDVMDESATQCHAIVMDNATLKRQVAQYEKDMKHHQNQMNDLQRKFDDLLKAYTTELSGSRSRMDQAVAAQFGSMNHIPTITNIEGLKQVIAETNQHYNRKYALERQQEEQKRVGSNKVS